MSARDRFAFIALAALVVGTPAVAGWLVHRGLQEAHAASAPFDRLVADSAVADSAAIVTLPEALSPLFAVYGQFLDGSAQDLALFECIQMPGRRDDEVRRRLQMRFADSSAAVLFGIADRTHGTLKRVEFVRRTPRVGQRGFIWDGVRDRTQSIWWFEGPRGLSRRDERGDMPRGGPVPRAVRALGRQLFVASCTDADANSPMNPISGSRD